MIYKLKKEDKLRLVYNSIWCSNNLVDISRVKGEELRILDQDHNYIMTYSFPCQDLSLAGLGKGMSRDGGTRSGMLWEVERILDEYNMPKQTVTYIGSSADYSWYFRQMIFELRERRQNYAEMLEHIMFQVLAM